MKESEVVNHAILREQSLQNDESSLDVINGLMQDLLVNVNGEGW